MAANLQGMFYRGEVPWHGQGKRIAKDYRQNVVEALTDATAAYRVGLKPLYAIERMQEPLGGGEPFPVLQTVDAQATYREDTGAVLGVVGMRYTVLQNIDSFRWFQPFLDAGECQFETAGVLGGGERVWVLASINRDPIEVARNDYVKKYLMLSNSHDGTMAVRVGFTPIRIVCANTLAMAHSSSASKLIKVRHTASVKVNLNNIRDTIDTVNQEFNATAAQYRALADRGINQKDVKRYIRQVFEVEDKKDSELSTRLKNTLEKVFEHFENGIGNNLPGVAGTMWAAYNSITQYTNYEYGRNRDSRLNALWYGAGAEMNSRALQLATDFVSAS